MAKQIKANRKDTGVAEEVQPKLVARSPMVNLAFAVALALIFLAFFGPSVPQAVVYGIGAFLFFNTVDYIILYYRMKKQEKE